MTFSSAPGESFRSLPFVVISLMAHAQTCPGQLNRGLLSEFTWRLVGPSEREALTESDPDSTR